MQEKLSWVKKIGNFISNILLGETKEIIIRTDERVNIISNIVENMKTSIDDFRSSIATHGANIQALQVHTKYGISHSPTIPSDTGKELLEKSKFNQQYPVLKNKIFTLMDTMGLRTLYDYENGAIKALEKLQNDPLIDPIKNYVVSNPDQPLDVVFKVASWIIRDDYDTYKKSVK